MVETCANLSQGYVWISKVDSPALSVPTPSLQRKPTSQLHHSIRINRGLYSPEPRRVLRPVEFLGSRVPNGVVRICGEAVLEYALLDGDLLDVGDGEFDRINPELVIDAQAPGAVQADLSLTDLWSVM